MNKFLSLFLLLLLSVSPALCRDMRFVQVSDARYHAGDKTGNLPKLVKKINTQKDIKFVVFTGDNILKPNIDDLKAFLKEVKKLKCPFYIVIGDKEVNKHKKLSKIEYIKTVKKQVRKYKPETPNLNTTMLCSSLLTEPKTSCLEQMVFTKMTLQAGWKWSC